MEKLIISQSPAMSGNIKALTNTPPILKQLIEVLLMVRTVTGVVIVNVEKATINDFIKELDEKIPNSDFEKQLHFRIDAVNDVRKFSDWLREQIADLQGNKIGGLTLTREAMLPMIALPNELIEELIQAKRDLDTSRKELASEQVFWSLITLEKGEIKVASNAVNKLTDQFSVYASKTQLNFYREISEALQVVSAIEKKYRSPGLMLKGIVNEDNEYNFNPSLLNQIP